MKHLVAAAVFILAFASQTSTQDGTCPNVNVGDNCYFDGVASLLPSLSEINQFYVIGGLFDIHAKGDDAYSCKNEISDKAILNILAFFWAVGHYGEETLRGKTVSVGAFAFDNCFRPEQTIENLLGFSQCKLFLNGIRENVVAYVGPYRNMDAEKTGMLASDLSLTLVSPDANFYEFDAERHKSLLRLKPSFDYDLKAIIAFIKLTNSEHFIIVHSSDEFYKDAHESLMMMVNASNLCANRDVKVAHDATLDDLKEIVRINLENQGLVRYLVPLMSAGQTRMFMEAVASNQNVNDKFVYILSSEVGQDRSKTTDKVIVVEPAQENNLEDFNKKLEDIRTNATIHGNMGLRFLTNPWLSAYLAQTGVSQVPLLTDASLPSSVRLSVSRTIKAVENIVKGMYTAMQNCALDSGTNYQMCDTLRNKRQSRDIISNVISTEGRLSAGQPAAGQITYNYYVYRNSENNFFKIGEYSAGNNMGTLNIPTNDGRKEWYDRHFVRSICPHPEGCCVKPTEPPSVVQTEEPDMTSAAPTDPPDTVSVFYPRGQEITGAYPYGSSIKRDYKTRFDDGHKWVIALGVLAGLGILAVLVFEIYIMYRLIGTPMGNKWRTMWLGQLLLFGILVGYLTLIAFIFVPTDETCGITRFGVGVSYAMCFAVLLVKLMVILTSKSSDVLLPGDGDSPNYLKGTYQFLMFIFAVGVQVVINVQWLITIPPEAIQVVSRTGSKVWVCNHYTWEAGKDMLMMKDFVRTNFENFLLSLIYIMALILITTILSLKAHGIITNHRESVFIGIAAGFSIPIWLAWGLVGGLNKDHDYAQEFGDACIAFGLFLTLTLILFAMFLPKVRQLVNMGVEGIYLEDDRDTYYAGSVIMAPPSYKSKGPSSVIYVNNQGIYSEPVVIGNGDPSKNNPGATHLKHPGNTYSAPPATFVKKPESTYGGSRILRVTDDLKGRHPSKKSQSEANFGASIRSRSYKGTLPRSRSQSDLGAL